MRKVFLFLITLILLGCTNPKKEEGYITATKYLNIRNINIDTVECKDGGIFNWSECSFHVNNMYFVGECSETTCYFKLQ